MKNADQPAHPTVSLNVKSGNVENFDGLTKREYFAAVAMQGILSSGQPVNGRTNYHPDDIAFTATRYADELLKQLES